MSAMEKVNSAIDLIMGLLGMIGIIIFFGTIFTFYPSGPNLTHTNALIVGLALMTLSMLHSMERRLIDIQKKLR